ncbi:MAG: asparagine--tRNA ligase [Candidatus Moeniiplasma glomeromycotorum]|nr:asparagine--tRNA ligase [Candidatus Moeniiplasma glomeromycotorum]MCE8162559.1 asparagine--tRNA ligase [Candidatus Moeniiplasma glomeromycotorum]MCE8166547.1 asparagine--tRNA ligase [Candidatus Moeniiplasma glomeromycotorum]MCE8166879.1 asparagine--tRNA ligase [Candidatus Moeniiplasma glomeromycotorum]
MLISIKEIYRSAEKLSQLEKIKVGGWVKSVRQNKFIELNDGSCLQNLQLICPPNLVEKIKQINFGSSLIVSGKLILTPERVQSCELQVQEIEFIRPSGENYPLQKKNFPLEVVRNFPHLRAKTNYFSTIFRLRHSISKAIHDFFHQESFYYVPTPIITSSDTEGAGELFSVTTGDKEPFFPKTAKLTVSGQLQAEALAQGLGRVYTFAPCFRAEKSHTTRHLAEFWMVEPEMTFADLESIINLAERMIKYVVNYVLDNNSLELKYLENYDKENKKELVEKLKKLANADFKKIDYGESIKVLEKNKKGFVFNDIKWGMDLQSEHEKYLCQHFGNLPVFVINYPVELKAFYMKNNPDGKTVAGFDLLFPEIGELIGGSMREDNYQILQEKARKIGLDINNLNWYLTLRQSGYAPSGGFGLGLERLIMLISGTENIRDTIAFPRYPKHLDF